MSKVSPAGLVGTVPAAAPPIKVNLPGGVSVSSMPQNVGADAMDQVRSLLAMAAPAMAPLSPAFNIIGVVMALKDFAKAVPGVLTAPQKVVEALEELLKRIDGVATMVPPLSVPIMVKDVVDSILAMLEALAAELHVLADEEERIAEAQEAAVNFPGLNAVIALVQQQQATQQNNLAASLGAIAPLVELINTMTDLAGLGALVPIGLQPGQSIQQMSDGVNAVSKTLREFRSKIPL